MGSSISCCATATTSKQSVEVPTEDVEPKIMQLIGEWSTIGGTYKIEQNTSGELVFLEENHKKAGGTGLTGILTPGDEGWYVGKITQGEAGAVFGSIRVRPVPEGLHSAFKAETEVEWDPKGLIATRVRTDNLGDGPQAKRFTDLWEAAGQPSVESETVPGNIARRPSSENITLDAYSAKHGQLFDKVLSLEKEDGWVFKKELAETKIYTKEMPGQRLLYFKGVCEMTIPGGIPALMVRLLRTEDRPKWDELCSLGKTPSYYPPYYKYSLVHVDPPAPMIAKREMLAVGRFRFEQDGALVIAIHSLEDPAYPETGECVRINFMEGGYVMRPKPGEDSTFIVTFTGLVDPSGWLPTWLANIIVVKQGGNLSKMKEFILKEIASS